MTTIALKSFAGGTIELKEDRIALDDKSSRMNKGLFQLYPFLFLFAGAYQIYTGMMSERENQLIMHTIAGVMFLTIPAMLYHSNFIRTNKKTIELHEIENAKMKKIFGEILIDFTLKDNTTRRVYNIKSKADWQVVKTYLEEKKIICLN
ncbi:hypothetical protein [Flavobacterium lacus]|jgi:hypothetical protein|uniref:Uncharacterized protein n=1 Tax=Flavobacterium lacus TaxID=1353778 RepID=A0A328WRK0_9FLAO|nr:hypothetical protein [Flavobacterium lacus]RAR47905.1 hypothetical protein B0I10_107186 [Flavobacterium lacus]